MEKFVVENEKVKMSFNIPSNFNEVDEKYLAKITENIKISDNYSLVALVFTKSVYELLVNIRQKSDKPEHASAYFIKAGNTEHDFIKNAKCKTPLIMSAISLNNGYHVNVHNNILDPIVMSKLINDVKPNISDLAKIKCCFVTFKIIANCDIIGFNESDYNIESEYLNIEQKNK